MGRVIAGLRAARVRPGDAVKAAGVAAGLVLLAACGPAADGAQPAAASGPAAATSPPAPPSTPAASTTPATTPVTTPAPPAVTVPSVVGTTVARAQSTLAALDLRYRVVRQRTSRYAAGRVLSQSPRASSELPPGSVVTITVAQAPLPSPPPSPQPTQAPVPAPAGCEPSYPDVCLKTGIGDYDCKSGSGNGPNYVSGPIRVRPPDPFGLDANGDGVGCENG